MKSPRVVDVGTIPTHPELNQAGEVLARISLVILNIDITGKAVKRYFCFAICFQNSVLVGLIFLLFAMEELEKTFEFRAFLSLDFPIMSKSSEYICNTQFLPCKFDSSSYG